MLEPLPVPKTFARLTELVLRLQEMPPEHLPSGLESRLLKEQLLAQLADLDWVPDPDETLEASRQVLAVGLLCGALDAARLYRHQENPEGFDCPPAFESLIEELARIQEVADQYWRGLDPEQLQEQSRYGRQLNMRTDQENVAALSRPDCQPGDARHLLVETFRTGYGVGVVDAALACLARQAPDSLPSELV